MKNPPRVGFSLEQFRKTPPRDLLIRFAFGVCVSTVAAVIAIATNSRFGGIFLAFPALLPATLTLIEKDASERQAKDDDIGAILGATALIGFAGLGWWLFPRIGAPAALTVAGLGWFLAAISLYLILQRVARRDST